MKIIEALKFKKEFYKLLKREYLRGYINGNQDKDFIYELDYLNLKYEEYIKDNNLP